MQIRSIASQAPLRVAAGTYILNSGFDKLRADDDETKRLHALAAGSYSTFDDMDPHTFMRILASGEIVLGGALLAPLVSGRLAGMALTAFAACLLGLYLKTPGMRRRSSIRPTDEGLALAKDAWLLGMGVSLALGPKPTKRSRRGH